VIASSCWYRPYGTAQDAAKMNTKALSACLLVVIVSVGFYLVSNSHHPVADLQIPELDSEPPVARQHQKAQDSASTLGDPGPPVAGVPQEELRIVHNGSTEFPINLDAGESDPGIIALAKEAGATPRCIVEGLRAQMELLEYMETNPQFNPIHDRYEYANPVSEECIQERRDRLTSSVPAYEIQNHAYEQYTDGQLEALAPYEADAAVLLARRIEDDRTSRTYYELAAQVTQDAKPLDEWLLRRGSVEYANDVLNVDLAKLGYETALIAQAFGSEFSSIREMYREALVEAGVDLAPVEASAGERISELKGSN
jgi:hypothetical protein